MSAEPISQPFAHRGALGNVSGLAFKNALLNIATLTLYRFWARTSMRRRLWSRAWIMGDSLEYTGTGWELFRGFLIALPTFFIPAIFVFYIAPFAMSPIAAGWLTFGFYIVAVPMIAAARYWMRRYQLSRTRWRGIRMGLEGSAWSFAAASWGWTILQTLSLGWFTPSARMKRAQLLWSNARFGDQPFNFIEDGKPPAEPLWWPFALGWIGNIVSWFIAFVGMGIVIAAFGLNGILESNANPTASPENAAILIGVSFVAAAILALALMALFWAPYNAAAMNRIASLIELDGARFKLRATTFGLLGVTLAGWTVLILSLGLLAPIAGMLQVRYVINRLELVGTPRFAEIGQSIVAEPKSGESIADAFDLDMGVGII
ncbi:thymidylate kinase [alpha proteobacterium U9-1i]|nr:thymidylate kinase [alpha proteobacterium U9-1i]